MLQGYTYTESYKGQISATCKQSSVPLTTDVIQDFDKLAFNPELHDVERVVMGCLISHLLVRRPSQIYVIDHYLASLQNWTLLH